MDKQFTVVFRNVGQLYFPQTRVECHYSLNSDHRWSSNDWIGIFEMGWSSLKQYHTYTWALVPEGYTEGTSVNYYALFHASYLPRPSAVEYQFVYVDKRGKVCARSRSFTFCAPKPLEELETMKEEQTDENEDEELLLVIPRAQLLQSRLEECLKGKVDLQQALDVAKKDLKKEHENSESARMEWENERHAMKEEITELRDSLRHSCETLRKMEGDHRDVKYSHENVTSEMKKLLAEKTENELQIKNLEEEIQILTEKEMAANNELERVKERMKKMSCQMTHDEEKRKSLQVEMEASLVEVKVLQERLEASDHVAESLRRELRDMGTRQSHIHTELHQSRLQVAQLTLQLSEEDLMLREERANSTLEREAYKHAAESDKKKFQELSSELQRKEGWLQEERMERDHLEAELGREKVLLSDAKQELQELKASLTKVLKEREDEQLEKQYLVNYILQLEQRLERVSESKWSSSVPSCISPGPSSESDEEASSASSELTDRADTPAETHSQSDSDEPPADTQDEKRQRCETRDDDGKKLFPPELVNPILSVLADSPMW